MMPPCPILQEVIVCGFKTSLLHPQLVTAMVSKSRCGRTACLMRAQRRRGSPRIALAPLRLCNMHCDGETWLASCRRVLWLCIMARGDAN
jgi:hypothetical protein